MDLVKLKRLTHAVRSRQPLPPDVAVWVAARMVELIPPAERLAERNRLLRRAGALVGGSTWRQVRAVQAALLRERAARTDPAAPPDEVSALAAEALILDVDTPTSVRQLLRILSAEADN